MSFLGSRSPNPFGRKLSRCRTPTPTSSKHWPTTDEVRCDGEGSFVTTPFARGSHRTLGRVDRTLYPRGPDVEFQAAAQAWGQDLPGARRDWRQTARYGRASLSTALSLPTTKPRSPFLLLAYRRQPRWLPFFMTLKTAQSRGQPASVRRYPTAVVDHCRASGETPLWPPPR